jgi:hypothetical protein
MGHGCWATSRVSTPFTAHNHRVSQPETRRHASWPNHAPAATTAELNLTASACLIMPPHLQAGQRYDVSVCADVSCAPSSLPPPPPPCTGLHAAPRAHTCTPTSAHASAQPHPVGHRCPPPPPTSTSCPPCCCHPQNATFVGKPAWIRAKMEQEVFPSPAPEPWVLAVLQVGTPPGGGGGGLHFSVPAWPMHPSDPSQQPCESSCPPPSPAPCTSDITPSLCPTVRAARHPCEAAAHHQALPQG